MVPSCCSLVLPDPPTRAQACAAAFAALLTVVKKQQLRMPVRAGVGQGRDGPGTITTRPTWPGAWHAPFAPSWPCGPLVPSPPIPPAAQIHVQAVKSGGKFVETFFKASGWRRTGSNTCTAVPGWPARLPLL